jgi:RNA-directed DNA polymerase
VRYADDLMVLVKSERAGQRVKANLTTYLGRQLKLPVNEKKSQVAKIDQCVFLGFRSGGASCAGRMSPSMTSSTASVN